MRQFVRCCPVSRTERIGFAAPCRTAFLETVLQGDLDKQSGGAWRPPFCSAGTSSASVRTRPRALLHCVFEFLSRNHLDFAQTACETLTIGTDYCGVPRVALRILRLRPGSPATRPERALRSAWSVHLASSPFRAFLTMVRHRRSWRVWQSCWAAARFYPNRASPEYSTSDHRLAPRVTAARTSLL